ncbi:MAG: hypothetical protein K0Q58_347 [Microbacterium sp.]|nr:hypothetical protein [Microbacterium sp.]
MPHGHGDIAEPERSADGLGHRSGDDEDQRGDGDQGDRDHREQQLHGLELPDRTALVDLVDAVHGPAERADVAGRRPDRQNDSRDQGEAGAGRRRDLLDRSAEHVRGAARCDVVDDAEDRVGGGAALSHHAEEREDGDESGEQREHTEVGQGGGDVGALIRRELSEGLPQHVLPGALRQVIGGVGFYGALLGRRPCGVRGPGCGCCVVHGVLPSSRRDRRGAAVAAPRRSGHHCWSVTFDRASRARSPTVSAAPVAASLTWAAASVAESFTDATASWAGSLSC